MDSRFPPRPFSAGILSPSARGFWFLPGPTRARLFSFASSASPEFPVPFTVLPGPGLQLFPRLGLSFLLRPRLANRRASSPGSLASERTASCNSWPSASDQHILEFPGVARLGGASAAGGLHALLGGLGVFCVGLRFPQVPEPRMNFDLWLPFLCLDSYWVMPGEFRWTWSGCRRGWRWSGRLGSSSRRTDGACGARSLCLRERRTTMLAGDIARDCVFVVFSLVRVWEPASQWELECLLGSWGGMTGIWLGSWHCPWGQSLLCDRGSHHQGNEGVWQTLWPRGPIPSLLWLSRKWSLFFRLACWNFEVFFQCTRNVWIFF